MKDPFYGWDVSEPKKHPRLPRDDGRESVLLLMVILLALLPICVGAIVWVLR